MLLSDSVIRAGRCTVCSPAARMQLFCSRFWHLALSVGPFCTGQSFAWIRWTVTKALKRPILPSVPWGKYSVMHVSFPNQSGNPDTLSVTFLTCGPTHVNVGRKVWCDEVIQINPNLGECRPQVQGISQLDITFFDDTGRQSKCINPNDRKSHFTEQSSNLRTTLSLCLPLSWLSLSPSAACMDTRNISKNHYFMRCLVLIS